MSVKQKDAGSKPATTANNKNYMKTKKDIKYSYHHVKKRLLDRYSILITYDDYITMNESVKIHRQFKGVAPLSIDNNGDQEIWIYKIPHSKTIKIVYSISRKRITTVLPLNKEKKNELQSIS